MPGELILYPTKNGGTVVRLRAGGGTFWLTQLEIAELFETSKQNVSLHIKNVLAEGELAEAAAVKDCLTVRIEGGRKVQRKTKAYSLEMVLAVSYRIRSRPGIQFRQWATSSLGEYLVKGFVMDDERLKEPGEWGLKELPSIPEPLAIRKATRRLRDVELPPKLAKRTDSLALLLEDRQR
jgi:hypothetical protein